MAIDINTIRKDFSSLNQQVQGQSPVYFDNACVTLRPDCVIDAMLKYYREFPGCHGRSTHYFGERTSQEYALARESVRGFINARSTKEIIFTRNTTEGINLLANIIPLKGKVVLISELEHNSNLLPWQKLKKDKGVEYRVFELNSDRTFSFDKFREKLDASVGLVCLTHVSNVTGVTHPIEEISRLVHKNGSLLLVDGAQAVSSISVDVQKMNVDFYVFSAHKMLGPCGIGCIYGKAQLLEDYPPFLVGGETVEDSTMETFTLAGLPDKYEAGIQDYPGAMGLRAAIGYINKIGIGNIKRQMIELNTFVTQELISENGLIIIGPDEPEKRNGIFNFFIKGIDSYMVTDLLHRSKRIMVRCGKHCAHSWYNNRKVADSVRASFYIYNTKEEADSFIKEVKNIIKFYKK